MIRIQLTRDDEAQAAKYRDELSKRFSDIDILLLGGERERGVATQYDGNKIRVISYAQVLSQARAHFQWLVDQLAERP